MTKGLVTNDSIDRQTGNDRLRKGNSWFARDVTAFPVLRIRHVGVQQHAELHMP